MLSASKSFVGIALLTASLFAPMQPPAGAEESKGLILHPGKELVLTLKHKGHGNFIILLSEHGIHVTSTVNGGETISAAPDWKVVCFQRKAKTQWTSNMESFSCHSLNPLEFSPPTPLDRKRIPSYATATKLCGVDCLKDVGREAKRPLTWWWAETNIPTQETELYCRYFIVPWTGKFALREDAAVGRLPTRRETFKENRDTSAVQHWGTFMDEIQGEPDYGTMIEVTKIEERPYKAEDFKIPTGLAPKKNLLEVMSPDGKTDWAEMMGDGFTIDSKRLNKK